MEDARLSKLNECEMETSLESKVKTVIREKFKRIQENHKIIDHSTQ